ncbi:MAG: 3-oxoacyl-ACP reductase FabG [Armatimonadetes bacterium]|nr:3-oxoacyl-ACP reductase FabG [Armatimonadota bacterium]MDE2207184.1 3-oxoacyl-ACP reductase FabG [Armatimonadota bacterium]
MSTMPLVGKVALVTGASRGIGAAIARRLAHDGAAVAVHCRERRSAADAVAAEIVSAGGIAAVFMADLSDVRTIPVLVDSVLQKFGHIDVLVNNAGVAFTTDLNSDQGAQFETLFGLNVRAVALVTQAVLRQMGESGGCIINLSSGAATACPAGLSLYSATKAAVEVLTRTWAQELGRRGIRVNAVAPGLTESEMLQGLAPPDVIQKLASHTPLGRLGQPEDIARVVAFLASPDAAWITGQVVGANGGFR